MNQIKHPAEEIEDTKVSAEEQDDEVSELKQDDTSKESVSLSEKDELEEIKNGLKKIALKNTNLRKIKYHDVHK